MTFQPVLSTSVTTPPQTAPEDAVEAARKAYEASKGSGNSAAATERLRKDWVLAKARTLVQ